MEEANWCRLILEWYAAVDKAGIDVSTRLKYLMNMRQYLLNKEDFGTFPPPGQCVLGLPLAQFEGLLTDNDRRWQLYKLTFLNTRSTAGASAVSIQNFVVKSPGKLMCMQYGSII